MFALRLPLKVCVPSVVSKTATLANPPGGLATGETLQAQIPMGDSPARLLRVAFPLPVACGRVSRPPLALHHGGRGFSRAFSRWILPAQSASLLRGMKWAGGRGLACKFIFAREGLTK